MSREIILKGLKNPVSEEEIKFFCHAADLLPVSLTGEQVEQFIRYYDMLIEKNKVMNLTAITDFREVVTKHFIDSLSLIKVSELHREIRLLDLGTGAGFPGIPLKIAFPELDITLLDSLNKRIIFLQEVIGELDLKGIRAIHGRAEELAGKEESRESYDLCVSRAVAKLSVLSEFCIPFVKQGGYFISYKSGKLEEELEDGKRAAGILGGKIEKIEKFSLSNQIARSLVVIKKVRHTPAKYPRSGGRPVKQPL